MQYSRPDIHTRQRFSRRRVAITRATRLFRVSSFAALVVLFCAVRSTLAATGDSNKPICRPKYHNLKPDAPLQIGIRYRPEVCEKKMYLFIF